MKLEFSYKYIVRKYSEKPKINLVKKYNIEVLRYYKTIIKIILIILK